ncbi:MAG: DUF2474 domain-containing protein [Burkholderiales bacterium]|nr:MAG: DUF2474 domain-containing protein [Burkholderiales bacterium]
MKLPTIEGPPEGGDPKRPLGRSLVWFLALWVGGLVSVAVVAYALRALIL